MVTENDTIQEDMVDEDMDCGVCGEDITVCGGHPFDPRYPDAPHLQPCFCGAETCLKTAN